MRYFILIDRDIFCDMTPCNMVDCYLLLKMEAVRSPETSVKIYRTVRRHIAEYSTLQFKQLLKNGSE
jgi:hypothetical protein